jgi:hypothetical protein
MKVLWDSLQAYFRGRGFDLVQVTRKRKNSIIIMFRHGPSSYWTIEPDEVELKPDMTVDALDAALFENARVCFEKWEVGETKSS